MSRLSLNDAVQRLRQPARPVLIELDLSGSGVEDEDVGLLSEALHHNTTLRRLYLNGNSIGDEGVARLSEALHYNTTLTHLCLGINCIGEEGAARLSEALHYNTTLTHLYLYSNRIGAEGAAHLSRALHNNTTLTRLNLGNNRIGVEGAACLSEALHHNTTLTRLDLSLDLSGNGIPDEEMRWLQELAAQPQARVEARRRAEAKQKEEKKKEARQHAQARVDARRRAEAKHRKEEALALNQNSEECRAAGSLVDGLVRRVNEARQWYLTLAQEGAQTNPIQHSHPSPNASSAQATSSATNWRMDKNTGEKEEQLLHLLSAMIPRLIKACRGWRDPCALEPVASCIGLEREYDQQQQSIRDTVRALHDRAHKKEDHTKREESYSRLAGLVAERNGLCRQLVKQAEKVREWACHPSGGQQVERELAEITQLVRQALPAIKHSLESLDLDQHTGLKTNSQTKQTSKRNEAALPPRTRAEHDNGVLRESVVSRLARLEQKLRERAEALRKEDSDLTEAIEAAAQASASALSNAIRHLTRKGDMAVAVINTESCREHSGQDATTSAVTKGLVELNSALNQYDCAMRSAERTKLRHELLKGFRELLPQASVALEHQERALLQVHLFVVHVEKRRQELLKWMIPDGSDSDNGGRVKLMERASKEGERDRLRCLRPRALVELIDSVWDARDESQEAQYELERVLLEQRQQQRKNAPRRERQQQAATDQICVNEWMLERRKKMQHEASLKANQFNELVSKLACVAVAHFPELLVAPTVAAPQAHEVEEEESALWHLLHEACDSGGLVVPGRQLHHYTDIKPLATAGQDARHDVLLARLLQAPLETSELRVLKRYALVESDSTSSTSNINRSMRSFLREIRLLHSMEHPNIAHITAVFFDSVAIGALPPSADPSDVLSTLGLPARTVSAFIEMPFYAGGTLDQWLERNRNVLSMEKLKALSCELLRAIEYLHLHGVVHCDVKPQNVLMTSEGLDGSVRLSDFDVSQDNDGRARALATASMHERTVAITLNYAAPELLHPQLGHSAAGSSSSWSSSSTGGGGNLARSAATWASDMFSVGVVLVRMFFGPKWLPSMTQLISDQPLTLPTLDQAVCCLTAAAGARATTGGGGEKRQEDNDLREQVAQLLDILTGLLRIEPTTRTTATQALAHAFFTRTALTERVAECVICQSGVLETLGVRCHPAPSPRKNDRHFTCNVCFDHHVLNESQREARLLERDEARVRCPGASVHMAGDSCAEWSRFFSDSVIAEHTSTETFNAYMQARKQVLELRMAREMEHQYREAMRQEIERLRRLSAHQLEVEDLVRAAREDILTLKCPRCGQAFIDFKGCFALTCSRCSAGFCGWCLADCGTNAHGHVAHCAHNRAGGSVYGERKAFEASHKQRRIDRLHELLLGRKDEVRRDAVGQLQKDLRDLGMADRFA